MVMQCLMFLEFSNMKNVSKMFSDLVNCNIRHKKVSNLMNSICNQNLWKTSVKKNCFHFKKKY